MAAENIDWHAHINALMARGNVTQEELRDAYSSWGKGYDKVVNYTAKSIMKPQQTWEYKTWRQM